MPEPRRADLADLDELLELEAAAFDAPRRASRASLRRSLTSARQSVWVIGSPVVASLVLWHFPRCLRVYGVAVHPDAQGQGLGARLMAHATALSPGRIVLEADARDARLLAWYHGQGFRQVRLIDGFYLDGRAAWRLERART